MQVTKFGSWHEFHVAEEQHKRNMRQREIIGKPLNEEQKLNHSRILNWIKEMKKVRALICFILLPLLSFGQNYNIAPTSTTIGLLTPSGQFNNYPLGSIFLQYSKDSQKVQLINLYDKENIIMSVPDSIIHFYSASFHFVTKASLDSFYNATMLSVSSGGGGGVSSVGLSAPSSVFSVSGTPVTSTGTLGLVFKGGLTANQVLASPDGSSGPVSLRSLSPTDIPLNQNRILAGSTGNKSEESIVSGDLSFTSGHNLAVFQLLTGTNPVFTGLTVDDASNVILGFSTGTKFGTSTSQKMAFYNSAPIIQPSGSIINTLNNLGLSSSATLNMSELTQSDVTTNNVSVSAHGFAPKLDGNTAHFLNGGGAWSTPAGGGGGSVTGISIATANGLAGSSDGNASNPTLTYSTTVTSGSVVKALSGAFVVATPNTDYLPSSNATMTGTTTMSGITVIPSAGSSLTIAAGKTFQIDNSIRFIGTDNQSATLPTTSCTLARRDGANIFTGIQTFSVQSVQSWSTTNGAVIYTTSTGTVASTGAGSTTQVLHGVSNGTAIPTYSAVSMSADVTGTLTAANGGTGTNVSTLIDYYTSSGIGAGWASTTIAVLQYQRVGARVDVVIDVSGTGANPSTTVSFTLPFLPMNFGSSSMRVPLAGTVNAGTVATTCLLQWAYDGVGNGSGGTVINAFTTSALGAWTNGGYRELRAQFTFWTSSP